MINLSKDEKTDHRLHQQLGKKLLEFINDLYSSGQDVS